MVNAIGIVILPAFAGLSIWFALYLLMDVMVAMWQWFMERFGGYD
jgi:hypothetical protein